MNIWGLRFAGKHHQTPGCEFLESPARNYMRVFKLQRKCQRPATILVCPRHSLTPPFSPPSPPSPSFPSFLSPPSPMSTLSPLSLPSLPSPPSPPCRPLVHTSLLTSSPPRPPTYFCSNKPDSTVSFCQASTRHWLNGYLASWVPSPRGKRALQNSS